MSEKKENKTRLLAVATQIYAILVARSNPENRNMRDASVAAKVREELQNASQIAIGTARVLIKAVEEAEPPKPVQVKPAENKEA